MTITIENCAQGVVIIPLEEYTRLKKTEEYAKKLHEQYIKSMLEKN